MTIVTYIDPDGDRPSMSWMGYVFPAGEPVDVADEWLVGKARGNRHFMVAENNSDAPAAENQPRRRGRPPKVRP